jgi:hypothetical protein
LERAGENSIPSSWMPEIAAGWKRCVVWIAWQTAGFGPSNPLKWQKKMAENGRLLKRLLTANPELSRSQSSI